MKKSWFQTDNWIINTKLSPPSQPTKQIIRKQLLEKATQFEACQITLVHAPAGYGKTTFLKQWYELQLNNQVVACWLSLDEEDKNLSLFFTYMVAALRKGGVSCDALEKIVGQGIEKLSVISLAAIIINTLEQFDRKLLFYIDDYHLASDKAINELIQKIMLHLPDNASFILSSRMFPELAVQSLLSQGIMREISINDLRFNLEEMSSVIGNKYKSSELMRFWKRTEGWPIACHLVKELFNGGKIDVEHVDAFSGRTIVLADYITEQVFESLSENKQKFLMYTAVVDCFTGDLANVLCDEVDCWSILEKLKRVDLFLAPLDLEGKWYRYNQLFREYLYERLRRNEPEKISFLHNKAANWLFDNDHITEAVEQALKGKDMRLAAEMVNSLGGWRLIYQDKLDWLASIFDRMEKPVLETFPRLFLAELILMIKRGRPQDALQRFDEMYEKTKGFEQLAGKPLEQILRNEIELVKKLILEEYNDQPVSEVSLSLALEHLKVIPNDDRILKALLHDALSSAYIDAAMLEKAISHINNATIMYKEAGFYYGSVYICYHHANYYLECAKLMEAGKELRKAEAITCEYLDANVNVEANTSVFLADLAYMKNQVKEAGQLLDTTLDFIEKHDGWFDMYAKAYTTAAGIALAENSIDDAIFVLERARRTAMERSLPRLKILCEVTEIKFLLLAGQIKRAHELAKSVDIVALAGQGACPDNLSVFIPERATIVLARLHLLQNEPDDVLRILQPLAETLQAAGRNRLLVEIWLLMALAAYDLDDNESVESCFSKAVHISMYEDYKRPFVDEGKSIIKIYNFVVNNRQIKIHNQLYRRFLADIRRSIQQEASVTNKRLKKYDLTLKEYKVVMELAKGYNNKEIASILYISDDTVKYRLKRLFKKWEVSSRDAVIRKAKEKSITP